MGGSLKYYRTDFIGSNNITNVNDDDRIELAYNAGELLSIAENTLYLIGKNEYHQLFTDNTNRFTAVYFREELVEFDYFYEMIKDLSSKGEVVVYIFSWGFSEFSDQFQEYSNVIVKSIPQPILEIYQKIYNL